MTKPLGGKAYGSIPHLIGSRRGPADKGVNAGQQRIATEKARDRHDTIIVQEKLDGSCVGVAKINGLIVALTRAGYEASTSQYEQHRAFDTWVKWHHQRFVSLLREGERVMGEWLAQAHGTRYALGDPFAVFDIMRGAERARWEEVVERVTFAGLSWVPTFHIGPPLSVESALSMLGEYGLYGALDPVEGAVWRVERQGKVDFVAKFVRPDKVDGCYLPEISGKEAVLNWDWRKEFSTL